MKFKDMTPAQQAKVRAACALQLGSVPTDEEIQEALDRGAEVQDVRCGSCGRTTLASLLGTYVVNLPAAFGGGSHSKTFCSSPCMIKVCEEALAIAKNAALEADAHVSRGVPN